MGDSIVVNKASITDFASKYDLLYLHNDEDTAKRSPFKGIIGSGLHTMSFAWNSLVKTGLLNEDCIGGVGMDEIRWKAPVYPGDTLTTEIEVFSKTPRNEGGTGIIQFKLVVFNQNKQNVCSGKASIMFKMEAMVKISH